VEVVFGAVLAEVRLILRVLLLVRPRVQIRAEGVAVQPLLTLLQGRLVALAPLV
jgi:hypothetical protein